MEQTTQQIAQKPSFPIKTKIIAWILKTIGLFVLIFGLLMVFFSVIGPDSRGFIVLHIVLILLIPLPYVSGVLLFKRKRLGWYLTLIPILLMVTFFFINNIQHQKNQRLDLFDLVLFFIIPVVFFIVLFLDRKNFFKIAS